MTALHQRMLADLQVRNYAERTQRMYLARVAPMARNLGRSPDRLTPEEVEDFVRHYRLEAGTPCSALEQMATALRLLNRGRHAGGSNKGFSERATTCRSGLCAVVPGPEVHYCYGIKSSSSKIRTSRARLNRCTTIG